MCFHRCSCVEPSDPTNDTQKYWEMNNVTASEIYWEALEVKVAHLLTGQKRKQMCQLGTHGIFSAHNSRDHSVTQRQTENNTFRHFHLKVACSLRWI